MIWQITRRTLTKFLEDNGAFLAAGLAFNLVLYCMPLALLAVSAMGYTIASSEAALAWIQETLQLFVPTSQAEVFEAGGDLGLRLVTLMICPIAVEANPSLGLSTMSFLGGAYAVDP